MKRVRILLSGMMIIVLLVFVGCTASLDTVQRSVTVQGVTTEYVFATGLDKNGGNLNVMDRYQDGKVVARDAAMNPGILPAALNGAVGNAFMATGLGMGLSHIPPSKTNVQQGNNGNGPTTVSTPVNVKAKGGAGGAGGNATGGNATANPVNVNAPVNNNRPTFNNNPVNNNQPTFTNTNNNTGTSVGSVIEAGNNANINTGDFAFQNTGNIH